MANINYFLAHLLAVACKISIYKLTFSVNIIIHQQTFKGLNFGRNPMFYETKVLDAYGKLKKIVTAEELQSRHWKIFKSTEENGSFYKKNSLKNRKTENSKRFMTS